MNYLGIDPGSSSGCLTYVSDSGEVSCLKMQGATLNDIWLFVDSVARDPGSAFAIIEEVHAMPGQGVTSTFSFGQNYGSLLMALTAARIPYEVVRPIVWQRALGVAPTRAQKGASEVQKARLRREHKLKLRAKAEQLFPEVKMTNYKADALLLAEYGRRMQGAKVDA